MDDKPNGAMDEPIPIRDDSEQPNSVDDDISRRLVGIWLSPDGFEIAIDERASYFEIAGVGEFLTTFAKNMMMGSFAAANQPSPLEVARSIPQDHRGPGGERRH